MNGGLHPFIAFTYFSARPLNDTHSYTLTLHPSFLPSSSSSNSLLPSALHTNAFIFLQSCTLSLLHLVHSSLHFPPVSLFSQVAFAASASTSNTFTPFPELFYTSRSTKEDRKRQRDDRGAILSKGWVGLQYTRLPQEEAMWAFFCSLPRESVCLCVGLPIIMIVWEDCFGMLAVVSLCKCSPNIKGLDYE